MKTLILAGGKGVRLGLCDRPKPMVEFAGKPLLQHQLELLVRYGFKEVMLLTGFMGDVIRDFFEDGSRFGVCITYHRESEPLGTAGAFPEILDYVGDDSFLVLYGDLVMDFHLPALVHYHRRHPKSLGTLVTHPNSHPQDSDLLDADLAGRITGIYPKPHATDVFHRNLANAAVYILSPEILRFITPGKTEDWGKDVFPRVVASGGALYSYQTTEYIKDIGTKKRMAKAEKDWLNGRVARSNKCNSQRAVFLDRDGVINRDVDNLRRVEDMELLPGAAAAVREINEAGYIAVVVTNQPAIAKGWLETDGLRLIHNKMDFLLGREGAYIDALYYCPHHPDSGFEGEISELKIACECRKPKPGMLLRAATELHLDLEASCLIGDSGRDIAAGRAGNVGRCVRIQTNRNGALLEAVTDLLRTTS